MNNIGISLSTLTYLKSDIIVSFREFVFCLVVL